MPERVPLAVHPRVSVSEVCTLRSPLPDEIKLWNAVGIETVALSAHKLRRFGFGQAIELLRASLPRPSSLGSVLELDLTRPDDWVTRIDERIVPAIQAAEDLGAPVFVCTSGAAPGMLYGDAEAAFRRAHTVLTNRLGRQVPLAVEHVNPLATDVGFVHDLRTALDLARSVGQGVCLEIVSCYQELGLLDTIAGGIDVIRTVQVADLPAQGASLSDRLVPGDGVLPIERIIGELLASGYHGAFELEYFGPAVEAEGYESALRRATAWLSRVLTAAGA